MYFNSKKLGKGDNKISDHNYAIRARKKTFKSCQPSLPNQQYIDSKIFEVNTLIEKVKDTLHDIKTNAKIKDPDVPSKVSMDKGTYTEETFIAQVVYENVQNGEDGRPKTRRIDILDQDMFRDFISEADESRMEQLTSLERLQLKLNTISEMNESDLSSNLSSSSAPAVCKGGEKVTTVSSCCNTEPVIQKTKETQAEPEVKSSGTQIVTEILDSVTQTTPVWQDRVLTIENTTQYEITEPLNTTKKLTLQNLPPINITGDLVCQKIHQLSIDPDGRTHVHYASGQHNVAYVEVHGHDDLFGSHPSVIDIKKKVKMLTDVDSNNVSYLALEDDNMSVCSNADPVVVNQLKGVTDPVIRASNGTKELVYKSFQLLDNPNMHDPGELSSQDMDVTAIDTSVYKTFINPEGFPDTSSDVDRNTVRSKSFLKHHISSMAGTSFANKLSMIEKDFKLLSNVSRDVTELSLDHHKANFMKSTDKLDSSRVEINSKLWDIGLYCSKGVQCCNLPKTKKHVDDSRHDRISLDNRDPVISASSYERISLTVSYSTDSSESLDITEPSLGKTEDRSAEDRLTPAEAPNHELFSKMIPKVPSPVLRKENSRSDEAGEAAISKQKQADEDRVSSASISRYARKKQDTEAKKSDLERADEDGASSASISRYARKKQDWETKKSDPMQADEDRASSASISRHARKKQDSEAKKSDAEQEESDTAVDSFISGLLNTKSDELRKVIPRLRKPSRDKSRQFTVLPLQIHGDCWPGQQPKNPHLKLADNGRYKDEENLFSKSSFANLEDVSMRRRALRCLPPRYCYRNFSLMAQNSDSVSMDDTISEGEVKCECSGSMGEVHRCKSLEPTSTMRQQRPENMSRSFKDEVSGTVRERRSYFNNLITYFVDKKAQFSDRSSPNSR